MGRVRSDHIKKVSRRLLQRFPDKFTSDFDSNKQIVETLAKFYSKKLRNRIAGYITRLVTIDMSSS